MTKESKLIKISKPAIGLILAGAVTGGSALIQGCYYNPYIPPPKPGIVISSNQKNGTYEIDYTIANSNIDQVDVMTSSVNSSSTHYFTIYLKSRGDPTTGSAKETLLSDTYSVYTTEFLSGVPPQWGGPSDTITITGGKTSVSNMAFDNPF